MLKTAVPSKKLTFVEVGDSERSNSVGGVEVAKKSRKSKSQKMSQSQKSAKSKKLSKSGNSPNFNAKNSGLSFLTPKS